MKKSLLTVSLAAISALSCSNFVWAANDPDSIGRTVKFLDYANPSAVSLYLNTCGQAGSAVPTRCVKLSSLETEAFNEANVISLDVAAGSRSMIGFSAYPVIAYAQQNWTAARRNLPVSIQLTITIESDLLNDPSLLNPLTNAPFNGKLEIRHSLLQESRSFEPAELYTANRRQNAGSMTSLISRKMLVDTFGLSNTRAQLVMTRALKVHFGVAGTVTGTPSMIVVLNARLLSD